MAAQNRTLNEDDHFGIVSRDMKYVHPITKGAFGALALRLESYHREGDIPVLFRPFEVYRTPHRQRKLRSGMGAQKVTGADAYQSAHQFGLAVDFVVWDVNRGWSWDDKHPWHLLKVHAEVCGLKVPYSWDRVHVEHPAWQDWREVLRGIL